MGIDSYLEQLCSALDVTPLRRDEIRLEVHTHLRENAETLMQQGKNEEEAEDLAVEEFGEVGTVAGRLSSSGSVFPSPAFSRKIGPLDLLLVAQGFFWVGYALSAFGFVWYQRMEAKLGIQLFVPILSVIVLLSYLVIRFSPGSQVPQHVERAGLVFIGQGFFWVGYGFNLLAQTYHDYAHESILLKAAVLALWALVLALHLYCGIGLIHYRRWARRAALLLTAYNLFMFIMVSINIYTTFNSLSSFLLSALPPMFSGLLGLYALYALLHPQNRQISWT